MMPPTQPPTHALQHFPPPLSLTLSPSYISSPTPELPDVFHGAEGMPGSWASGPPLPTAPHLPSGPPLPTWPKLPAGLPSPTCQKLRPPRDEQSDWIVPGSVGRLAIKESVFGSVIWKTLRRRLTVYKIDPAVNTYLMK